MYMEGVFGPIDTAGLGQTLMHEHITCAEMTISIPSKWFLTACEKGARLFFRWLRSKESQCPPDTGIPFHSFPPWLHLPGFLFAAS